MENTPLCPVGFRPRDSSSYTVKPENPPPTPCDQELAKAIALWREQHKLREDDAVLLLVQLLKIHQQHWMELWKQQMPPLENLHHDVLALLQLNKSLQTQPYHLDEGCLIV